MWFWLMDKLKNNNKARLIGSRPVPYENVNTDYIEKILVKDYGWDIFPLPDPTHIEEVPYIFQRDIKKKSGRIMKPITPDPIEKITIYKNIFPLNEKSKMIKIKEYDYVS